MGLFVALLSAIFSAAKDVVSKRLASRLDGMSSTFASFACALPFYVVLLALLYFAGAETFTLSLTFFTLVLLRSVTDTLAEGMKMHALAHGDLSIVATFFALSPLFLLFTSPLITGDRLTFVEAAAVILTVSGSLVLVYRPSHLGWARQKKGILLATGAALFFSLNSCFDRLAVKEGTPVFAGFAMTLLSALFLFPFVALDRERRAKLRAEHRSLWLRGLLEVSFMSAKLYALQTLQAPDVAAIQRLSLLLSIIGGRVFFKEQDFGRRLTAGALILGGVFLIAWLRW
jgi:drug/metabolite transporter (DMT)-like permease